MSATFTTGKADLEKPANGDDVDSWNVQVNANMDAIDACFSGELNVAFTNANVALSQAQMRNALIVPQGTLSNNVVLLFFPNVRGMFTIANQCVGAFQLAAGAGSTVPLGGTVVCPTSGAVTIFTDGFNVGLVDDGMVRRLVSQEFVPPGMIADFGMSTAPTGWLVCDGAAVSRSTYASLFANIGTTWGAGNGSTTFNLPPLNGQFRRGWDQGGTIDPARAFASAQADAFAAHSHGINDPGHVHPLVSQPGAINTGTVPVSVPINGSSNTGSAVTGITIQNAGGTETRPKNYAVLTCIKT